MAKPKTPEPETTPAPETSEAPSTSGAPDDVELDAVELELEPGEAEASAEPSPEETAASAAGLVDSGRTGDDGRKIYLVSREVFYVGFCKAQKMAGLGLEIKTLVLAPELDEGREASDAIYDTAAETPALHWMLNPSGKWIPRLAAIGMYSMVLKAGLVQEAKARKAAKAAAEEPAPAAAAARGDPGEDMAPI